MSEDGVNAGARNFGRFCLSLIPWALAIGAAAWGGVYLGMRSFYREVEQEKRAAVYTGAEIKPKGKLDIEVLQRGCVRITHVDDAGSTLMLYAKNECMGRVRYMEWHWELLSPNRTVVKANETNGCPLPVNPGDSAECIFSEETYPHFEIDDRAKSVRVWTRESVE